MHDRPRLHKTRWGGIGPPQRVGRPLGAPIHQGDGSHVLGVVEFYQRSDELEREGPGQALALALLRPETVESQCSVRCPVRPDFAVVHGAVGEALEEVRAISASLRLPELEVLTMSQVAERVVRNHQRRSGTTVSSHFAGLPEQASLPIKIALYRALEEGLSNAARHGQAKAVQARIRVEDGQLCLAICDQGPGFDTAQLTAGGRLGLAAVQERAALLGGHARVESAPGRGTTLWVWLPLSAPMS